MSRLTSLTRNPFVPTLPIEIWFKAKPFFRWEAIEDGGDWFLQCSWPFSSAYGILLLLFDVVTLKGLPWSKLLGGGYVVIVIACLIGGMAYGLLFRPETGEPHPAQHLFGWWVVVLLYTFGALVFAIRLYPMIPSTRGGGDFHFSPEVILRLHGNSQALPPSMIEAKGADAAQSKRVVIVYETPDSVMVMSRDALANLTQGIRSGVVEIRKQELASIEYLQ